ncbi:MAG: ATP-dependent sacrificial sulfur transferase LarE [Candidatus Omnitrophota bacterium]
MPSKIQAVRQRLKRLGSVVVAYSGGVDSTLLLKLAKDALGDRVFAVTVVSPMLPKSQRRSAALMAKEIRARHRFLKTQDYKKPAVRRNALDRCYHCKKALLIQLKTLARRHGFSAVVDGSNADDLLDDRPGAKAKEELGVISPLQEAGLTKKEIRRLSRRYGLSSWNMPAQSCLATRVPFGSRITEERLRRIDLTEERLRREFHLRGRVRVRDFGKEARIEVDENELGRLRDTVRLRGLLARFGYDTAKLSHV